MAQGKYRKAAGAFLLEMVGFLHCQWSRQYLAGTSAWVFCRDNVELWLQLCTNKLKSTDRRSVIIVQSKRA